MESVIHFEMSAKDIEKVKNFYERVFRWQFKKPSNSNYWFIKTGNNKGINGGIKKASLDNKVINIIEVRNIEETIKKIKNNNGEIIRKKALVKNIGWLAYFKDTEKNIFGILQRDKNK